MLFLQSTSKATWWDDEEREGSRNVGFFYLSDAADCPRRFYLIMSPRKLQIIRLPSCQTKGFLASANFESEFSV
jgi:hypothetical protein